MNTIDEVIDTIEPVVIADDAVAPRKDSKYSAPASESVSASYTRLDQPSQRIWLKSPYAIITIAVAVWFTKVLFEILAQYRWYFPADFEQSAFLIGRQSFFHGWYEAAFYTHIVSGPIVLLLACFMMLSGLYSRPLKIHRRIGKLQFLLVIGVMLPSGLIMATRAFAGPIAGAGFATLTVGTAVCMLAAANKARLRQFQSHRLWATRLFILLASPILLRTMTGFLIVTRLESEATYQLNAWLSWFVPLIVFELLRKPLAVRLQAQLALVSTATTSTQ